MNLEEYCKNLGKVISNMQSLEFSLRAFLLNSEINEKGKKGNLPTKIKYDELKQGEIVSEDAFTNWDTLGDLIRKYNGDARIKSAGITVDETLVNIRDALAHGRVSSDDISTPMTLLKFKQPKNKSVEVEFSVLMTIGWFKDQIHRFYKAVMIVHKANDRLLKGQL